MSHPGVFTTLGGFLTGIHLGYFISMVGWRNFMKFLRRKFKKSDEPADISLVLRTVIKQHMGVSKNRWVPKMDGL